MKLNGPISTCFTSSSTFSRSPRLRFELKSGIQNGRHIPRVQLVMGAARLRQAIRAIEGGLMAAGAAHGPVDGDSRIEEKLPAELNPRRRDRELGRRHILG